MNVLSLIVILLIITGVSLTPVFAAQPYVAGVSNQSAIKNAIVVRMEAPLLDHPQQVLRQEVM